MAASNHPVLVLLLLSLSPYFSVPSSAIIGSVEDIINLFKFNWTAHHLNIIPSAPPEDKVFLLPTVDHRQPSSDDDVSKTNKAPIGFPTVNSSNRESSDAPPTDNDRDDTTGNPKNTEQLPNTRSPHSDKSNISPDDDVTTSKHERIKPETEKNKQKSNSNSTPSGESKIPSADDDEDDDDDDTAAKANTSKQQSNTSPSSSDQDEIAPTRINVNSPRIKRAHAAIHAWKRAIVSDPRNFTDNWVGPNVCAYNGIICAPSPDDPSQHAVAGIDFNGADMSGHIPVELSLFKEVTLIHVNSNQFQGEIPQNLSSLERLRELDLSNNGFAGPFPMEVLRLPELKYLDLRFNNFEGPIPPELFDKDLDAIFLNNNRFNSTLPENMGNSKASVIVLANNNFEGPIPSSVRKMGATLDEMILTGNNISGCIPHELGYLGNLTVMDLSFNSFIGMLSKWMINGLHSVEQLNIENNSLTGILPDNVCQLKHLANFTYSSNYFQGLELKCGDGSKPVIDGQNNCMVGEQAQRTMKECAQILVKPPVDCRRRQESTRPSSSSPSQSSAYRHFNSAPPSSAPPAAAPQQHYWSFESIPPVGGYSYASPPPPMFKGY